MKILFTCNRVGTGGAERVICNFANRMVKDGNEVRIVCLDILDGFYYPLEKEIRIVELDTRYKTRNNFLNRKIAGLKNLYKLYYTLKSEKPDMVISFYTRQNCYSILVCSLLGIPIIAAERDHFFTIDSKLNAIMRRIFYPHASGFIHQTNWAKDYLRKHCKINCQDIILPNPVWFSNYPKRQLVPKRIIAVGRLDEQKNYQGLIRAFKNVSLKIPEAELYIYGEGRLRNELEKLIAQLNITDQVHLVGITKDVISCYAQADIFVLFSHGEGYPNVLMEALALGVPCISTNCPIGGPADMINDGQNGTLVECNDEVGLSEKMITLLLDEKLKEKYSANAVNIRETNSFEQVYNNLMEFIYMCTKKKLNLEKVGKELNE